MTEDIKVYQVSTQARLKGRDDNPHGLSPTLFAEDEDDAREQMRDWADRTDHELVSDPEVELVSEDPDEFLEAQ